jgi:hypothetical protein
METPAMKIPRKQIKLRHLMVLIAGTAVLFATAKWWANRYPITAELTGFEIYDDNMIEESWSDGIMRRHQWKNKLRLRLRKYPLLVLEDWSGGTTTYTLNWHVP